LSRRRIASIKKVAAHAIGDDATRIAAEAGVDSIERAYIVPDDVLKMTASKKIFMVPTDYPEEIYTGFTPPGATPEERKEADAAMKQFAQGNHDRLKRAVAAGVRVAAGSDEYYQMGKRTRGESGSLIYEAYRDSGMTPWQIIQAATVNGAELLDWQGRIGSIEAGKFADPGGDIGRSVAGCDGVGEGQVRDEGWGSGSERFHRAAQTIMWSQRFYC
jgi:imidazolonepropionase-like amidohydrolase